MAWYKSKKGWFSAVLGVFVLDHWGRFDAAKEIYQALRSVTPSWSAISPWVPLGLFALAVLFFEMDRRKGVDGPALSDIHSWKSTKQETVYGKSYTNATVEADGKLYLDQYRN